MCYHTMYTTYYCTTSAYYCLLSPAVLMSSSLFTLKPLRTLTSSLNRTFLRPYSRKNSSNALMESVNLAGLSEEYHQVNIKMFE